MKQHHASILRELLARSAQAQSSHGALGTYTGMAQYARAYECVERHVADGATVLDWGGDSGHFAFFLYRMGYATSIFSFDPPSLVEGEVAEQKIDSTLGHVDEPVRLPYPDGHFDAVLSIGVLEHVRQIGGDERASLHEIRRVLKPGGTFICYHLPNRSSWIEWLAARLGRFHHPYTFGQKDVIGLFAGIMPIVECRRYAMLPRNILRVLPGAMVNSHWFCTLFDAIDSAVARCVPWLSQNWLVVARKASAASS